MTLTLSRARKSNIDNLGIVPPILSEEFKILVLNWYKGECENKETLPVVSESSFSNSGYAEAIWDFYDHCSAEAIEDSLMLFPDERRMYPNQDNGAYHSDMQLFENDVAAVLETLKMSYALIKIHNTAVCEVW